MSKLLLALLGAILLVALAASIPVHVVPIMRVAEPSDASALGRFRSELLAAYERHGSWDFLRRDPSAWADALRGAALIPPRPFAPIPGATPNRRVAVPVPSLMLLDDRRRVVIGYPQVEAKTPGQPMVANGRVVGWLGDAPLPKETRRLPFTRTVGAEAVLVATFAAVLLTRWLLRPVRHIAVATHRLAAGDYTTRLTVPSHDEIGRLADDFNRLAHTLEKNERMRRAFMADMSHELRTPIAALRAQLEGMEDGVCEVTVESLRSLQSKAETIGKLVNDLYELSLADTGALTYRMRDIDIAEMLRVRLRGFRERPPERRIALEADIPDHEITIRGDETRLQQLIGNLVENSLRYTDVGGLARVCCHCEAGRVIIDLHDSEPGVPHELLPRLFERFFRVEAARSRETGGAGLGLAICKSIVEAHDGTISAQESPLGGLWIRVSLPIAR